MKDLCPQCQGILQWVIQLCPCGGHQRVLQCGRCYWVAIEDKELAVE